MFKDDRLIINHNDKEILINNYKYIEISFLLSIIVGIKNKKLIVIPIFIDSLSLDEYKYIRLRFRFKME